VKSRILRGCLNFLSNHLNKLNQPINLFCATNQPRFTLKSQSKFESVGGDKRDCINDSNCGTVEGRLEAGVTGTFQGGMTQRFTGTFSPDSQRTKGRLDTFDHNCDASTSAGCAGTGFGKWQSEYFTGISGLTYDWWGWVYHAGQNGSWVNSSDGNERNITGD
jgi:hypothetical protein